MSPRSINLEVRQILSQVIGKPVDAIQLEHRVETICRDSIQLFEVVLAFEKAYHAEVGYEELMSIETVEHIVQLVQSRNLQLQEAETEHANHYI